MTGGEPTRLDRLRRAIGSSERWLNRRGWTLGIGAELRDRIEKFDEPAARSGHGSTSPPPAGWYDGPDAEGVRRYWNGTGWTDSRVTTDGIRYQLQGDASHARPGFFLAAMLLAGGGVCVWIAETYKPTLTNQLGLNGNSHVLTSGAYRTLMIVGIVCLALGATRLLAALLP